MNQIIQNTVDDFSGIFADDKSFKNIYFSNYDNLCVFLLNYTNDKEIVKDIVQDTFLKIWNSRQKISITTSVESYLRRAVYNNFINNYRLQKKRNLLLEAYYRDVVEMHFETDTNIIADMVSSLHQCIEKLPNKCKEVLVLSKIKGIKLKDLSVKLKVSRKTLEGHTTRAYVFLKDCLKKSHPSLV